MYKPSGMPPTGHASPSPSPHPAPPVIQRSPHRAYSHPQPHPPPAAYTHPQEHAHNPYPSHHHIPPPRDPARPGRFFDPISDSRPSRPPPSPSHSHANASSLPPTPSQHPLNHDREHPPPASHLADSRPPSATVAATRFHHPAAPPSSLTSTSEPHISPRTSAPLHSHTHSNSSSSMGPPAGAAPSHETRPRSTSRVDNPMSFSSILSQDDPAPSLSTPQKRYPAAPAAQSMDLDATPATAVSSYPRPSPDGAREHVFSAGSTVNGTRDPASLNKDPNAVWPPPPAVNGTYDPVKSRAPKPRTTIPDRDVEKALAQVDAMDESDLDDPRIDYDAFKASFQEASLKRLQQADLMEQAARKRRRIAFAKDVSNKFSIKADIAKERFSAVHQDAIYQEVVAEDVARDKERKKINQRTRRREVQKAKHEAQATEFMEKAEAAATVEERTKMMQQATKFERKARYTENLLNGDDPTVTRDATPVASSVGGIVGSFPISEDGSQDAPKSQSKKQRAGRLKKSKEQKQAEIDSAAAAHAAMERGDEPKMIAPKGEAKLSIGRDSIDIRGDTPVEKPLSQVSAKAYDTVYKSVWKEISKDLRTITRAKTNSSRVKEENLRKTALLASKEAKRWQLKTNKSQKEQQARAKRAMREMLGFWKRNEREERDMRKMAEKAEIENAKKAEADREANRQKRKLNFLISQTELYSHFIGKKVRTDEAEQTGDVDSSAQKIRDGPANAHTINLPDSVANTGTKVTNFEDLDFDAEDETVLQQAAMANAQNAVKEAQDRARAFNNEASAQEQFDDMDGEMNFQNPTSLQSMDIAQPGLLSCQLKEYQVKGLNWLVNLYEQGINGILADEMGLGKTVQSISVMAYLAETHNIWGPFLVIAPSSTLHNWQQEITRFVPDFKVLPYWGNAKDRKILRKIWDRKHITYNKEASFHVLITSYQLVVQDSAYLQKMKWQYMILDEAQAIKSSQSSRWKHLLSFHCRNRLLLTGTPIQNNMQELWALLHFIMPSLFDSHDEFSDWFSKDIESHAQSNTKLNEDQLKRLHMILKPFMLRRIKKHVQKELGDKVEKDVFCDLTYRQRAFYVNLRNKISIMDLIEKATVGDNEDTATLMNLVMQFRKVCNHPDLFERADTTSPMAFSYFAETASFMREGHSVDVAYSVRSRIEMRMPRLVARNGGRLDIAGPDNAHAGWRSKYLQHMMSIWSGDHIVKSTEGKQGFSWLPLTDVSAATAARLARQDTFGRAVDEISTPKLGVSGLFDDDDKENRFGLQTLSRPDPRKGSMLNIVSRDRRFALAESLQDGPLFDLMNVSRNVFEGQGLDAIEPCSRPATHAPPVELYAASQGVLREREQTFFNAPIRRALFSVNARTEEAIIDHKLPVATAEPHDLLPAPLSAKSKYTHIQVPSMRRFVTDSGKLAKLDELLKELKAGGHRVLLYFQMTRMIDLMEEYLTYRNYKYCRLDGSTKLEDRRDTVADFQSDPSIFVFLLSTRAGGLGINLTAADTVIFYDSDWNPTIDSQAMDRAHRLGQTRQVTVYRLITRGTIEERIRRRALQKEEVQRVVISGGAGATVDFNNRSQRENRTKDIALWLADDDQAAEIERAEAEMAEREARDGPRKIKKKARPAKELSLDDMYHEGEGNFDDGSKGGAGGAGGAAPAAAAEAAPKGRRKGTSKKAKTAREKLAIIDGTA